MYPSNVGAGVEFFYSFFLTAFENITRYNGDTRLCRHCSLTALQGPNAESVVPQIR